jgi:hypothetical protein
MTKTVATKATAVETATGEMFPTETTTVESATAEASPVEPTTMKTATTKTAPVETTTASATAAGNCRSCGSQGDRCYAY